MSDTDTPTMMTVAQVARSIPGRAGRDGKGIHPSAVTRWIVQGIPARNGERVKLAAVRVGGRWMIRPDDLEAFFAALASTTPAAQPAKKRRTEAQRRRATEAAARALIARGA